MVKAMVATARRQKLIEFGSTVVGAILVAVLFPDTSGVLLMMGAIIVAFWRLLKD
jgi:hypothetical protein